MCKCHIAFSAIPHAKCIKYNLTRMLNLCWFLSDWLFEGADYRICKCVLFFFLFFFCSPCTAQYVCEYVLCFEFLVAVNMFLLLISFGFCFSILNTWHGIDTRSDQVHELAHLYNFCLCACVSCETLRKCVIVNESLNQCTFFLQFPLDVEYCVVLRFIFVYGK